MKTQSRLALLPLILLMVVGCNGEDIGESGYSHECNYEYNDLFIELGLVLDHTDTRACDFDYEPEDWIETAFVVYDNKFIWGEFEYTDSMAYSLETAGYTDYNYYSWTGSYPMEQEGSFEYFDWGTPREPGWPVAFEWQAQGELGWEAGIYTDYIEARVAMWVDLTFIGDAIAVIEITYLDSEEP